MTPLRSVQADSMLENGIPEYHRSTESTSPDRSPFLNNPYTTSELSFDNFGADENLSSDQSNRSGHKSVINHDRSLDDSIDDTDWDSNKLHTTGTGYIEHGDHLYCLGGEPGNTGGRK